jgi:NAD(P)H dehydrogenase (quinone)
LLRKSCVKTGREIPYKNLPQDEYATVLKSVGVPEGFAGALFDEGRQLSALIGRPTTLLADAIAAALKG